MLYHQKMQSKKIVEEEREARRKAREREKIIAKEFKRVNKNIQGIVKG
jgi:hypothetical protein